MMANSGFLKRLTEYDYTKLEPKKLMNVKKYINNNGGMEALNYDEIRRQSAACAEIWRWIQDWMEAADANIQANGLAAQID